MTRNGTARASVSRTIATLGAGTIGETTVVGQEKARELRGATIVEVEMPGETVDGAHGVHRGTGLASVTVERSKTLGSASNEMDVYCWSNAALILPLHLTALVPLVFRPHLLVVAPPRPSGEGPPGVVVFIFAAADTRSYGEERISHTQETCFGGSA